MALVEHVLGMLSGKQDSGEGQECIPRGRGDRFLVIYISEFSATGGMVSFG